MIFLWLYPYCLLLQNIPCKYRLLTSLGKTKKTWTWWDVRLMIIWVINLLYFFPWNLIEFFYLYLNMAWLHHLFASKILKLLWNFYLLLIKIISEDYKKYWNPFYILKFLFFESKCVKFKSVFKVYEWRINVENFLQL